MGVNRQLFISNRWDVEDVQDTLESLFDTKVTYVHTHCPGYAVLTFMVKGDEFARSLNCHMNTVKGGFKGLLLTLGTGGKSEEILKALAERLGGFYNKEDFNSTFEEYQYQAEDNLEFLLKDAMKKGASDGSNGEKFREFLVESEEQHKKWQEENTRRINEVFNRSIKKGK